MGNSSPSRRSSILIIIETAFLVAFSIALYCFARRQEIWVDETTQLSGITLRFGEMLSWLSGHDAGRFGVPGDRMPPVSYVLDWTWLRLFGPSEVGFRLFHATFVLTGVAVLIATAWRNLGKAASFVTLAFLCLSPKLIETAVEIRAYPIFFAASCVQTAVFVHVLNNRNVIDRNLLLSFVTVSIISVYTHFFGLVSDTAFFFTLGLAYIRRRAAFIEIVFAFAITLVGSVGILPFVFSAVTQSALDLSREQAEHSHEYLTYIVKLIGAPANLISTPAAVLFFGGAFALFLIGVVAGAKRMSTRHSIPVDWLLIVIVGGVSASLVASHFVKNFEVLKSSYSIWIFAPLALFVASGAAESGASRYRIGLCGIAAAAIVGGATISTYTFVVHATDFVHGPGEFVSAIYDQINSPKAVVYKDGAASGWSYFPLVFTHKGEVVQYQAIQKNAELARIMTGPIESTPRDTLAAVAPYESLILVDVKLRTYNDIRQCLADACPQFHAGELEKTLSASGSWQVVKVMRQFGLYDTQVIILRRTAQSVH